MPLAAPVAALAGSALGLTGNIFSNLWNTHSAQQQAQWNLNAQHAQNQFNLDMWHRANEYNSPKAQMQRFAEAGLNPHLIYGKGTAGNTTPIKSADVKPYSRPEMRNVMEGVNVFEDLYNFRNLQAQTDNTEQQTQVQESIENLNQIRAAREAVGLADDKQEYEIAKALRMETLEGARAELAIKQNKRQLQELELKYLEPRKKLEIQKIESQLYNDIEKRKGMRLDQALKYYEIMIKKFETELNELGLTKTDEAAFRFSITAARKLGLVGDNPPKKSLLNSITPDTTSTLGKSIKNYPKWAPLNFAGRFRYKNKK